MEKVEKTPLPLTQQVASIRRTTAAGRCLEGTSHHRKRVDERWLKPRKPQLNPTAFPRAVDRSPTTITPSSSWVPQPPPESALLVKKWEKDDHWEIRLRLAFTTILKSHPNGWKERMSSRVLLTTKTNHQPHQKKNINFKPASASVYIWKDVTMLREDFFVETALHNR